MIGYVIQLVLCLMAGGAFASYLKRNRFMELNRGRSSLLQRAMHFLALAIVFYPLGSGMFSPSWGHTARRDNGYLGCMVLGFFLGWMLVGTGEGRGKGDSS